MEKKLGFIRVASAIPVVEVANPKLNADRIIALIEQAAKENVKIVCFPELCLTGYTCADLFYQRTLIDETEVQLERVNKAACENGIFAIVGAPVYRNGKLYNAAYVAGAENDMTSNLEVYKNYLPSNNEFYEKRWFTPGFGENKKVFEVDGIKFGIEICEDLWMPSSPSDSICLDGAEIIFNLSASDELIGKEAYRRQLVKQKSATNACAYVYTAAGFGESSTDLVFSGTAIIAENGSLIATSERFSFKDQLIVADIDVQRLQADRLRNSAFIIGNQNPNKSDHEVVRLNKKIYAEPSEVIRTFAPHPFVPPEDEMKTRCNEIFSIQVGGLATRLYHTGIKHTVVGISGGLDSTLALLVTVKTFDKLGIPRKNIVGITMPGFGTTGRTYNNSIHMMQSLGITIKEIDIKPACLQHLKDIEHDLSVLDVSYENTQARERTQILMDYANKMGAIVIGTGDLSELVLGWCTYNGDHMSMYAVNTSIPKTLVKYLVKYVALYEMDEAAKETLLDVCDTPISPELLPADDKGEIAQKTEDFVGPYELHDFFIYYTLRFGFSPTKIFFMAQKAFAGKYDDATILKWMRTFYWRFFTQQFKRSCMPDGPKVGSVNLSPRGDWRMPSDANSKIWIEEVDRLIELAMKNAK